MVVRLESIKRLVFVIFLCYKAYTTYMPIVFTINTDFTERTFRKPLFICIYVMYNNDNFIKAKC